MQPLQAGCCRCTTSWKRSSRFRCAGRPIIPLLPFRGAGFFPLRGIPGTLVVEVWFARKPNTVKLLADVVYSKKVQHVQDWRTDALTLHLWGIDSCMPFRSTNAKVDPVRRASSEKPSTRIEIDIGGICGDLGPAFLKDLLVHSKSPLKTIALWTNAFLNRCVSGHYAKFVSRDQYLG